MYILGKLIPSAGWKMDGNGEGEWKQRKENQPKLLQLLSEKGKTAGPKVTVPAPRRQGNRGVGDQVEV